MDTLIVDPHVSERLIEERRARGADRRDEVWEGTYIMAPAPSDEHQDLAGGFTEILRRVVDRRRLGKTRPAVNLSPDPNDWEHDYRIPDIAVFLKDSPAVCHDTFWSGPPDFLVEITSPFDRTRDKLDFYSQLGTRELLIIDRNAWQLELYRLQDNTLALAAKTQVGGVAIESEVLSLSFQLTPGDVRPTIEITATELGRSWTV